MFGSDVNACMPHFEGLSKSLSICGVQCVQVCKSGTLVNRQLLCNPALMSLPNLNRTYRFEANKAFIDLYCHISCLFPSPCNECELALNFSIKSITQFWIQGNL